MVFKIFRRDEPDAPVLPPMPVKHFADRVQEWLDELSWYERACSSYLATETFSHLRFISDMIAESIPFLRLYTVRPEEEYIIEQTLCDYIPNALRLFTQLPPDERALGGAADKLLLKQCVQFEKSIQDLITTMENNVRSELQNHATFVENRFANPV